MIHQIVLCRLQPDAGPGEVENLMRQTRVRLLKIPEFRTVTCGKPVESGADWGFFFAADFENLDKMRLGQKSITYTRYEREILTVHVAERQVLTYELEPGKDTKYS